jgi:hypothetical protein
MRYILGKRSDMFLRREIGLRMKATTVIPMFNTKRIDDNKDIDNTKRIDDNKC